MSGRRRWVGAVTIPAIGGLLIAAALVWAWSHHGNPAVIRVNQVGYGQGESKIAYLLSGRRAPRTGFQVVDDAGNVVATGVAGPLRGRWNDLYQAVYPLDLSMVDRAGAYRVRLAERPAVVSPPFTIAQGDALYGPLAAATVGFFRAQRDGPQALGPVLDRKPSHGRDATATVYAAPKIKAGRLSGPLEYAGGPLDASGGWFDAGDYLKFTSTTAYALVNLLLAARVGAADPALRDEIEFGLRWLGAMWNTSDRVLYAQVGLGGGNSRVLGDHDVWRLPEADDALRPARGDPAYYLAYRPVFPANRAGSPLSPNLAGRVAAAFALAAQLHAEADPARARTELDLAAAVYATARTHDVARLVTVYPRAYYPEDSWADDLALGGAELASAARRLGDPRAGRWLAQAADWARVHRASSHGTVLSLEDVGALAHLELAEQLREVPELAADARDAVAEVRARLAEAVAVARTDPFGAALNYRYSGAAARAFGWTITALRYAQVTGDHQYAGLGRAQAGWALGANAWGASLVIGAGTTFPRCPHHQIANLGGSLDGAGEIAVGAVVNGPTGVDDFTDEVLARGMRACRHGGFSAFDGRGARYVDDVRAWPSVEPAIDVTSSALLAFALLGSASE